jgi:hypothetical protein
MNMFRMTDEGEEGMVYDKSPMVGSFCISRLQGNEDDNESRRVGERELW